MQLIISKQENDDIIRKYLGLSGDVEIVTTVTENNTDKPWYPDDSGEWIEHDGSATSPLHSDEECYTLGHSERKNKNFSMTA